MFVVSPCILVLRSIITWQDLDRTTMLCFCAAVCHLALYFVILTIVSIGDTIIHHHHIRLQFQQQASFIMSSTIIPHPPILWEEVRTVDMLFLLGLGAVTEVIFRGIVFMAKRKPASLRQKEDYFFKLEYDTKRSQAKGPGAFGTSSSVV